MLPPKFPHKDAHHYGTFRLTFTPANETPHHDTALPRVGGSHGAAAERMEEQQDHYAYVSFCFLVVDFGFDCFVLLHEWDLSSCNEKPRTELALLFDLCN